MWARTFDARLASWNQLRVAVDSMPADQCLHAVNAWWFDTPWRAYHLHWDDRANWPDPWQLLSDNIYCSLARGLGIMYTITMLDRADMQDAVLADTGSDNLVLVDKKKYILNWNQEQVLNINLGPFESQNSVTQEQIKQQIG
jgi:hypothetical protein